MNQPETDGGAFNVSAGQPLSILQVAEALSGYFEGRAGGQGVEITGQFRAGDIRHCYGDIGRLAELGFRPQVRFEQGIEELVGWVASQTAGDAFEQARRELDRRGLTV